MPLRVVFYRTASGAEPARDWLRELDAGDRRIVGEDLRTLQLGWPIGMPLARSLGSGLWELRTKLTNRIVRLIFLLDGDAAVVLHGFIKKSQATPAHDLETARGRKADYDRSKR